MCSDFEGFGNSDRDNSKGIFSGRPHGAVAVLYISIQQYT